MLSTAESSFFNPSAYVRLEKEVIQRLIQRDILQESVIYQEIQRERMEEITLNLLRAGIDMNVIAASTGLSIEELQQLQQQLNDPS